MSRCFFWTPCLFHMADSHDLRFSFYLSFTRKRSLSRIGCGYTLYLDEGKKNCFTIRVGPAPLCDLDVIHIFNSGCWLHAHYNAVCFCGVRYTTRLKTINEHTRSDAEINRALPDGFLIRCSVGHLQSVMSRGKTSSSDRGRCQSSHTTVILELYFQVGSRKHQQKTQLVKFS